MQTQVALIFLASFLELCLGDYRFEVLLESYLNPTHKVADGTCCNYPYRHNCGRRVICNNLFVFCARPYGYHSTKTSQPCPNPGAKYTTSVITDDNISFRTRKLLNPVANLSNPIIFYGKVWPGQMQLYTQVYNWDVFENQPIGNIVQTWSLPVSDSYSPLETFRSDGGHVTITARARVMCTNNYYGPYCSMLKGYNITDTNTSVTSPDDVGGTRTLTGANNSEVEGPISKNLLQDGLRQGGNVIAETGTGEDGRGRRVGTIVGGVLVGVLCLILLSTIIVVCVWFGRKKVAEQQAFKDTQGQEYQATIESPQLVSSSYSGTYRRIDNKLYSQVPTEDRGGWSESETATDFTISEAATASSDPPSGSIEARTPIYRQTTNRVTSQYSLVQRRDSDVSSCHSDEFEGEDTEMGEGKERREVQSTAEPIDSQYSVITRENMDHVSEASDSEDSHTHSDTELVEDKGQRGRGEQPDIKLYENIPYS